MWNGIKPTHLWHKTGQKHMKNMLDARSSAGLEHCPPRVNEVRERDDLLRFVSVIFGSTALTAYMFGVFSKPNDCSININKIEVEEEKCPSDPCPAIPQPTRPKKCPSLKKSE